VIEPAGARRVKLVAAVLWREEASLARTRAALVERFGPLDFEGPDHPFDLTDYYAAEMGTGLRRRLLSFGPLMEPEGIVAARQAAGAIERELAVEGRRTVNIDVGYLDPNKLVLASRKYGAMKVHAGEGVWADIVCRYRKGRFEPFDWSFADFKDNRYERDLLQIRERYQVDLRAGGTRPQDREPDGA
jgi:hypothetical protein